MHLFHEAFMLAAYLPLSKSFLSVRHSSAPAATALSASAWWQKRFLMPLRSSVAVTAGDSGCSGLPYLGALAGMASTCTICQAHVHRQPCDFKGQRW